MDPISYQPGQAGQAGQPAEPGQAAEPGQPSPQQGWPFAWSPGQYPYNPDPRAWTNPMDPGAQYPPPGSQTPPAAPPRRPWGIAGLIVAVFLSSVLGFGVAAHLRGSTAVQSPSVTAEAPSTGSSTVDAVAAKVDPGIVDINTVLGYQHGSAAGTGMVLTSSGEVLTNNHVIDGATSVKVTVVTTGKTYTATVVGTDPADDVAVLQLAGASGLKTIATGDSSKVAVGDTVVAIGNALGQGGTPSAVAGTVESLNQTITASDASGGGAEQLTGLIQTNAALQPGDSGGPLATTGGKVIGMDTAASSNYRFQAASGISFAIPINSALNIAKQIEAGQAPNGGRIGTSGFLGVQVDSTQSGSAVVVGVEPATPAADAGIRAGDTVVSVNGKAVTSPTSLTDMLGTHKPGDKVSIGWVDASGQSHSATVTLGTAPAN